MAANRCNSAVVQKIEAPVDRVWAIVRRFDSPQAYKKFIKSCQVINGDGGVGSIREVKLISGLPATCSIEKLEILDDDKHMMSFSIMGGDHRLRNYRSVTTVNAAGDEGSNGTVVVESYVVDIPQGNTAEETYAFVETIIKCNLASLAKVAELQ